MEFEKLKKNNFPTDRPIPEEQGRVRGNKSIFKAGLIHIWITTYQKSFRLGP